MAEKPVSTLKKSLEEEIKCSLCLNIYADPRRLPCEHVYCHVCLGSVINKSKSGKLTCPVCRGVHQIPEREFPKAFQVNRLIEMYRQSDAPIRDKTDLKPDRCEDFCETHTTQPLDLYCETCKSSICRDCALLVCSKVNHKYNFKESILRKYKEELNCALGPAQALLDCLSHELESVQLAEQKVMHKKAKALSHVEEKFDMLDNMLQEARKYQISAVEDHFDKQAGQTKQKEEKLLSTTTDLKNLIDSTSLPEKSFLEAYNFMVNTIAKLKRHAENSEILDLSLLGDVDVKVDLPISLKEFISQNISICRQVEGKCVCFGDANFSLCKLLYVNEPFQMDIEAHCFSGTKISGELVNVSEDFSQPIKVSQISSRMVRLAITPLKRGRHKLYMQHNAINVCNSPIMCTVMLHPSRFECITPLKKTLKNPIGVKCQDDLVYVFESGKGISVLSNTSNGLRLLKTVRTKMEGELLSCDNHLYITDKNTDRVYMLQWDDFSLVKSVGQRGSGDDCFSYPNGIRMNKNREIFVCDSNNGRIKVFDENLGLKRIFGSKGSCPGQFKFPADLEFDCNGNIFVVEMLNSRVQVLSPQEEHLRFISEPVLLRSPITAAICHGLIFVTSYLTNRVCVFTIEGEFVADFGGLIALQNPESIAIDQDGYVYITTPKQLFCF